MILFNTKPHRLMNRTKSHSSINHLFLSPSSHSLCQAINDNTSGNKDNNSDIGCCPMLCDVLSKLSEKEPWRLSVRLFGRRYGRAKAGPYMQKS